MDYAKIIVALLEHFIHNEGTDYLGRRGEVDDLDGLSLDENAELTRLRDIARVNTRWSGYEKASQ